MQHVSERRVGLYHERFYDRVQCISIFTYILSSSRVSVEEGEGKILICTSNCSNNGGYFVRN
jgi:hypothetical protein